MDDQTVRAAGGVVLRDVDGTPRVLAVHRPRYDDWSLPKGKLDPGESWYAAAVREVHEETGVTARLVAELTPTHYADRHGRPKQVHWWTMRVVDEEPREPDDEVDEVRWMTPADADALLTYDSDRALVREALAASDRRVVLVVRHSHAGDRGRWDGDDAERPLSDRGHDQARALVDMMGPWHVGRVVSSPLVRCVQTVDPLAADRGLTVEVDVRVAEGAGPGDTWALLDEVPSGTVVCSHGDVIGDLISHLGRRGVVAAPARWEKGSTWVLTLDGDRSAVAATHLDAP